MRSKKFLASIMAGAMVAGTLAGCGNAGGNDTTTAATTTAANTTAANTTAASTTEAGKTETEAGPVKTGEWEPFEDNVQIQIPVYDRSQTAFGPVDDNYWTKWIQKEFGDKYNITVKYVPIPRGDVMTTYNQLFATRDNTTVPTICMEYDFPKVTQWANDGALQTIDYNQFKDIAPTYYERMVKDDILKYGTVGGDDYFVFGERPYYDTTYSYVTLVRMDWLKKVGYDEVPQSYEEYTDALDKIVAAGLTDINPVGTSMPTNAFVLSQAFWNDVTEEEWAQHATLSTCSLTWKPTYEMLKRTNEEYNKGYLSSEFDLDTKGDTAKANFIAGKTYSYGGYMSASVDWLNAFYDQNPDAELAVASGYAGVDGEVQKQPGFRTDNPFGMIVGFSAVSTEDQVKAAMMYLEWMSQDDVLFSLQNGEEGKQYTVDKTTGLPVLAGDYDGDDKLNYNGNVDYWCAVTALRVVGDGIEDAISAITPRDLPDSEAIQKGMLDHYNELKKMSDEGFAYKDPMFSVSIAAESEYSGTLKSLYQEDYVQLVKCAPEQFDSLYADLSQKYLDAGYQEIIDERLDSYKNGDVVNKFGE